MIGILGGTFDPPHEGHLYLAERLLELYQFEKLLIVPTAKNPLKDSGPSISAEHRFSLLQTAFRELSYSKIEVLDIELRRPPPSFTVDTLEEIKAERPDEEFAIVVGNEVFQEFAKWKNPARILELAHCVVVNRSPHIVKTPLQVLHEIGIKDAHVVSANRITHHAELRWVDLREIKALPFSSTEIREQIAECWKKNDLSVSPPGIQRSVWLLIKENRLYCR